MVAYPAGTFQASDFNADGVLTNTKKSLLNGGTQIDGGELTGISDPEGLVYYSWTSGASLVDGTWVCNFARDIRNNHGGGGNRKVLPTCYRVTPDTPPPPPPPQFDTPPGIWLGYADDFHGVGGATSFKPSPWKGDPCVTYLGCDGPLECGGAQTGKFDSGAIRIDNADTDTPLKLVGAKVEIGRCVYEVWTNFLPATAAPGGKLVLTQTGVMGHALPQPCAAAVDPQFHTETNFDTSERPDDTQTPSSYNCNPPVRLTPVITLTFEDGPAGPGGDVTLTVNDTGRILNTGGVDSYACQTIDEAQAWTGPVFYTLP